MTENKPKTIGNLIYFDPNNVSVRQEGENISAIFNGDTTKDYEDYAIAVDLEVQTKNRKNIYDKEGVSDRNVRFQLKSTGNVLQGSEIGNSKALTSFFTDITHTDKEEDQTNESMCISSIDIEFNSWYVASVIIKFTDVRGYSLLSPTETAYNNNTKNKSLFSGFFTMPYPIFNLKVKGFYGDSVTYPLHITDFKADFNSATGNFDITATFIGYTYAMLNDIQLSYLVAAPYTESYGKDYWNQNTIPGGRFTDSDGKPLPRIPELLRRIKTASNKEKENREQNPDYKEQETLLARRGQLEQISKNVEIYKSKLDKIVRDTKAKAQKITTNAKSNIYNLIGGYTLDNETTKMVETISGSTKAFVNEYKLESNLKPEDYNEKLLGPTIDLNGLTNYLKDFDDALKKSIIITSEKVKKSDMRFLLRTYGIKPTIYNFNKLLLAHTETFLYTIYKCSQDAAGKIDTGYERMLRDGSELLDIDSGDNKIHPFPWYSVKDVNGTWVDEWIGERKPDFDEVKLTKSFVDARTTTTKELEKIGEGTDSNDLSEGMNNLTDDVIEHNELWYPLNAMDNSFTHVSVFNNKIENNGKNPYSAITNINNDKDLFLYILRNRTLMAILFNDLNNNKINYLGLAEARNIISGFNESKTLLTKISSLIKKIIDNSDTQNFLELFGDYNKAHEILHTKVINVRNLIPLFSSTKNGFSKIINNFNSPDINHNTFGYNYEETFFNNTKVNLNKIRLVDGENNKQKIIDWKNELEKLAGEDKDIIKILEDINVERSSEFIKEGKYAQPLTNRITKKRLIYNENDADTYKTYALSNYISLNNEITKNDKIVRREFQVTDLDNFNFLGTAQKYPTEKIGDGGICLSSEKLHVIYNGEKMTNKREEYIAEPIISTPKTYSENTEENIKENTNQFTYPIIGGEYIITTEYNKKIKKPFSLFTSPFYYYTALNNDKSVNEVETNRFRAHMFLQTLPINIDIIEQYILNLNKTIIHSLPKSSLLLIGSVLWKLNEKTNKSDTKIKTFKGRYMKIIYPKNDEYFINEDGNFSIYLFDTSINDPSGKYSNYKKISKEIQNISTGATDNISFYLKRDLIKNFTDWVDSEKEDGWKKIKNSFELSQIGTVYFNEATFFSKINILNNSNTSPKNFYKTLRENFKNANEIFNNYSRFDFLNNKENDYFLNLVALNKDNSPGVNSVLKLLLKETTLFYQGYSESTDIYNELLPSNGKIEQVNSFLNKISQEINKKIRLLSDTESTISGRKYDMSNVSKNPNINLQTYKTLKSIYDRWVSGYDEKDMQWIDENGLLKNFKFLDRSYSDIGNDFFINFEDVFNNIIDITINNERSLYSIITDVLSKNQFLFIPMPNYQSWQKDSDFAKIFEPIPYINSNMLTENPSAINSNFMCVYAGNLSKSLNIGGKTYMYNDDALNLDAANNETDIPADFKVFDDKKSTIPVFAVSYAKQNQSYFKNISVNMNTPVVTEASVNTLRHINENANKDNEVTTFGQDLYSLYSQYAYTCDVEMMGCAQIQPMMYFQLTNIPMYNGAYLIYKLKHSIKPGHMTTAFTGMRMAKSKGKLADETSIMVSLNGTSLSSIGLNQFYLEPESNAKTTLTDDSLIGDNFTLKHWTRTWDRSRGDWVIEKQRPAYIISRIQNKLAPTIDKIMVTWLADSKRNPDKVKFTISGGYRSKETNASTEGASETSQHPEGVACDIQVNGETNNTKTANQELNKRLYEHIIELMNSGYIKMDELIFYKTENNFCHVGVAKITGNNWISRGQHWISKEKDTTFEIKENAKDSGYVRSQTELLSAATEDDFIAYWKRCENNIGKGFDKDNKCWKKYDDAGEVAFAYGQRFLSSEYEPFKDAAKKDEDYLGCIPESIVIEDLRNRIQRAMTAIKKKIESSNPGSFDKIHSRYKYALVDLYLSIGNIDGWPKFIAAVIEGNHRKVLEQAAGRSEEREKLFKLWLNDKI